MTNDLLIKAMWGFHKKWDLDRIDYLIENHPETINYNSNQLKITPLMKAVMVGNLELVQKLVENGANLNLEHDSGDTALSFAIEDRNEEIALYLLDKGADPNCKKGDNSPSIFIAFHYKMYSVVEKMLQCGYDVNFQKEENAYGTILHAAIVKKK